MIGFYTSLASEFIYFLYELITRSEEISGHHSEKDTSRNNFFYQREGKILQTDAFLKTIESYSLKYSEKYGEKNLFSIDTDSDFHGTFFRRSFENLHAYTERNNQLRHQNEAFLNILNVASEDLTTNQNAYGNAYEGLNGLNTKNTYGLNHESLNHEGLHHEALNHEGLNHEGLNDEGLNALLQGCAWQFHATNCALHAFVTTVFDSLLEDFGTNR